MGRSLRPLTHRSYQNHLNAYLLPHVGNIPLAMPAAADLRVMFTEISRRRPAGPGDRGADPRQGAGRAERGDRRRADLRQPRHAGSAARAGALASGGLDRPPREAAWREASARPAVAVWTAGQTARFLAAIRGEPLYPCYQLMAVSGLRRGEAAGLPLARRRLSPAPR